MLSTKDLPSHQSIMNTPNDTPSEKLPASPLYGSIAKTPLIDDDDEADDENDPIKQPTVLHTKVPEHAIQANMPPPLTGLWRFFSDQIAREVVQNANQKEHGHKEGVRNVPAAPETAFDSDESQGNDHSIKTLPDESRCYQDDEDEDHSTPGILFQDTFSETRENSSSSKSTNTPYLDPDLVRRAHSNSEDPPLDLPKIVHVPSDESLGDAPERVSIHGTRKLVKHGVVELSPGKFVRVHGRRHAQSAIEKGQSTIVACTYCYKKFQVDRKAKALYCTFCDSVTELHHRHHDNCMVRSI